MARLRRLIGPSLTLAVTIPVAASAEPDDLGAVRAATAKYHQVENGVADGYELGDDGIITGCILQWLATEGRATANG